MDVVLGVAVADRIARLTLVGAAAQGQDVIDQSVVDLADNPIQTLTETVVGTNRLLADENHRLLATRLSWSDPQGIGELRRALEDSGVQNVVVLDESEAATAMGPAVGPDAEATAMAPAVAGTESTGQVGSQWAYSASQAEPVAEPEDDEEAETGPVRRPAAADLVLGIAVAGSIARLALVEPAAGGYGAITQSVVDLAVNPFQTLTRAVLDTRQALAGESRRLVATRLYSPDPAQAQAFSQALAGAGVGNVALIPEAEAVTALLRGILGIGALPGSLVLQVTADAATLLGLGAADALATVLAAVALEDVVDPNTQATAAVDMVLDFLRTAPFEVAAELRMAYVMGTFEDLAEVVEQLRARSPLRAELLDHPEFAIATGAAVAPAVALGDATTLAPTVGIAESQAEQPQLAYSMADDGEPLPVEDATGDEYYDDDEAQTTAQRLSGRSLLISNAVVAFAVIGFASLAVAVAITVRPTAAAEPVVGHQNAAPGKFMPLLPTQQQAPVPAPPADQPNAGYQGGIIPDTNGYIPPQLISPGEAGTPPGSPGLVPNPNGPIPIPIIIPFPGWRPPYPPYQPPIGPTTTYPTPPTITPSTPPSTPVTPSTPSTPSAPSTPSTPSSAPSTPSTPTTPSSAPPTSSKAPNTSTQAPTSAAPPSTQHTTVAPPHVQTQQTMAPKPASPQPVTPSHSGHH